MLVEQSCGTDVHSDLQLSRLHVIWQVNCSMHDRSQVV